MTSDHIYWVSWIIHLSLITPCLPQHGVSYLSEKENTNKFIPLSVLLQSYEYKEFDDCGSHFMISWTDINSISNQSRLLDLSLTKLTIKELIGCNQSSLVILLEDESDDQDFDLQSLHIATIAPVPVKEGACFTTEGDILLKDNLTDHDTVESETSLCPLTILHLECQTDKDLQMQKSSYYVGQPIIVNITGLITPYECIVSMYNESAMLSEKADESFMNTSDDTATQSLNAEVSVISSTEVEVKWDSPDGNESLPDSFTIVWENQTLNYMIPYGCSAPNLTPMHQTVDNDTSLFRIVDLLPDMQFDVLVMAMYGNIRGPSSDRITVSTPSDASTPVGNLTAIVTVNSTIITWQSPCLANGPLASFTITLNGTRGHQHTPTYTKKLAWEQNNSKYHIIFENCDLVAESTYKVMVRSNGISGAVGKEAVTNFTVPARIPSRPLRDILIEPFDTSANVCIHKKLFPDTEGTVKYYAVLVAEVFTHKPAVGWLFNKTWPHKRTWANATTKSPIPPYQTTPQWWKPFQDESDEVSEVCYEVGAEDCSPTDLSTYCNGPLVPGTEYRIRIRGFTDTGYRDTDEFTFQTESFSRTTAIICMLLLIITILTIIIFTIMVIKGNIKWVEDKKYLTKKISETREEESNKFKSLSIAKFLLHSEKILTTQELLAEEFDVIERSCNQISSQLVAQLSKNTHKNRYRNILPYDSTRVILDGDDKNNYINASHIKLPEAEATHYIACQGPKKTTCEDFWRMVIQYKVNVIVMLGLTVEQGMNKCFQYFPKLDQVLKVDNITVFCTTEEQHDDYVLRCFIIEKGGLITCCHQMHFTSWPDFGVPNTPEIMVQFVKSVRQLIKRRNPVMCVHCSAGVGRTGTFIAVDVLLQSLHLRWNCRINVLNTVLRLREQRCKMVQTQKQYKYIYQCLKYELENNPTLFSYDEKGHNMEQEHSLPTTESNLDEYLHSINA